MTARPMFGLLSSTRRRLARGAPASFWPWTPGRSRRRRRCRGGGAGGEPAAATLILAPSLSRSVPSTTTVSPTDRPDKMAVFVAVARTQA